MESLPRRSPFVGAWLWSFCFQFFIAEQIARMGSRGPYSMMRDYISDLGTARSSLHWVMNGSFVLQGFLIFFGAVLVRRHYPATRFYRIAFALFAVAGAGVLVVGLFPEHARFRLHLLGAVANFLGGNLAMIWLGLVMIRRSGCGPLPTRTRSWITFFAGSVGLLATLALGFSSSASWTALGWDAGMVERLAAYPLPLWLSWTGFRMLRAQTSQSIFAGL